MFRAFKNKKGFTLVELMVVVVIIVILTGIAVPVLNSVTGNANKKAAEANLRIINGAIMMYTANNEGSTPAKADLEGGYLQEWPEGPDGVTYDVGGSPLAATITEGTDTGPWFDSGNSWN